MQLGFVLLLVAIAVAMIAAMLEVAWPKNAWALSVVCGFICWGAAYDLGYHPEGMARAWGRSAANVVPLFLWGAGAFIELMCVWWLATSTWRWLRRRYARRRR